jgi:hypothetical protein
MEKKSLFVRIIALLLCVIMAGAVLASCAEDDEPITPTKKQTKTENEDNTPTFVDYDGNETEFIMLSNQNDATDFTDCYIDNEEMTGEPINDAVITRNKLVEEKYNVTITRRAETTGYAQQASQSGTVDFHVVYDWGFRLVPGVMDGIFYDLNLLNDDYCDLEQSYWAPSSHEDLTVADKLIVFTCDISMNRIAWASFIAFNKKLMDQFGLEYPYTYVNNNTWTYDKYLELVKDSYLDNGDGIWDQNDVYGSSGIGIGNVVDSTGWKGYTKTEEGRYELDFQLDKLQQIFNSYSVKFTGNTFDEVELDDWNKLVDVSKFKSKFRASRFASFGQDHIMMTGFTMDETFDLNGMESQYGVVPMPKYDTTQTEYYHYIDTCAPMFAIMKQADDDLIAVVLEYMNYESQRLLLPAFFEQTIKTKRMSDPEARDEAMLDIIRDSVHYKFGGIYGLYGIFDASGKGWDPIGTMRSEMLAAGQFKSVLNKYQSAAKVSLDNFYDAIEDLELTK